MQSVPAVILKPTLQLWGTGLLPQLTTSMGQTILGVLLCCCTAAVDAAAATKVWGPAGRA